MSREIFVVKKNGLFILPVCHYEMEFAAYVRRTVFELHPDAVAVELPARLKGPITEAVDRFPYLSAIFYRGGNDETLYLPIEPTDPFCEAVRSSREERIPLYFIDLDIVDYPLVFDPMPDPYSLYRIGLRAYWEAYRESAARFLRDGKDHPAEWDQARLQDERRERHMAFWLQRLSSASSRVLLVCGMSHVLGILKFLDEPQEGEFIESPIREVEIFNLHPDSAREVTGEMPFIINVYEMLFREHSAEEFQDEQQEEPQAVEAPVPEETDHLGDASDFIKEMERLLGSGEHGEKRGIVFSIDLLKALCRRLNLLKEPPLTVRSLGLQREGPELSSAPADPGGYRVFKFKSCRDRRRELYEFYREIIRGSASEGDFVPDRQNLLLALVRKAAQFYRENTGEEIKSWQHRTLVDFARRYATLAGLLLPDFYRLIVSARGVADDNFAYELWDLGSFYLWEDKSGRYETAFIRGNEVWLHGKKVTFRRRFPCLRRRLMRVPVRERMKEKTKGEWAKHFKRHTICSYPPEDIVVEDYGRYMKNKGMNILSEERTRVEPFSSTLLDGIDMRETIRNWHKKKIYVRENQRIKGGAGAVVIIFDDDPNDKRFPWKMTWHGEHHQESDMAFYSTIPGNKIVGPGIARCEYGGLMMTWPPFRLFDVWNDPFYSAARSKSEVLLMAAIEYSLEKHIIYVAARAPRSYFSSLASRLGKSVVYLPIGQFSPTSIKKIRVFHVLSGHHVRQYAKDYIW